MQRFSVHTRPIDERQFYLGKIITTTHFYGLFTHFFLGGDS
jgi:hypothetical protein